MIVKQMRPRHTYIHTERNTHLLRSRSTVLYRGDKDGKDTPLSSASLQTQAVANVIRHKCHLHCLRVVCDRGGQGRVGHHGGRVLLSGETGGEGGRVRDMSGHGASESCRNGKENMLVHHINITSTSHHISLPPSHPSHPSLPSPPSHSSL